MAHLKDIKVYMEIEPLVKLQCINSKCVHHLSIRGYLHCNLKYIDIDENGKCKMFINKDKHKKSY